jgi:hypothetical protein
MMLSKRLRIPRGSLVLACLFVSSGCFAAIHETHYYRSKSEPRNYYRVNVTASTSAVKTRYVAGYFDEEAVEEYFGEFDQPENGAFRPRQGDESPESLKPIDPSLDGRRLVMLLSTNSDEIATQLGAIAENEQTMEVLAGLVSRDERQQASLAQHAADLSADDAARTVGVVEELLAQAKAVADQAAAEERLLRATNELTRYLGAEEPFQSRADASAWITANAGRITR